MNLKEIREQFIKRSGRYDLTSSTTTWADNGADFFIRNGQKLLDRLEHTSGSLGKRYERIETDDWYAVFRECRSVSKVFVADDEDRWELEKKDLGWILLNYEGPIGDLTTGTPDYYAPAILREAPQVKHSMTLSKIVGETIEDASGSHFEYNGAILMPPSDGTYILEIQGLFYSHPLKVDGDESYWSVNFEDVLIMAACYKVEVFNRNTEGMKDWMNAIKTELSTIGMDLVEDDIAGISQMEG